MKPTVIKLSISQDGLLPQQSIHLGETILQGLPKKLMTALDFEKVDSDKKRTTFIGIMPVFVVVGEKTQEIEIELTVAHSELREKVVDIFTQKPSGDTNSKLAVTAPKKSPSKKPSPKKTAPKKLSQKATSSNKTKTPVKSASAKKNLPAAKKSSEKSVTPKTSSATARKTNRKAAGKK